MVTGNEKYIIDKLKSMPIEQARYAIARGEFGDPKSPDHIFASNWLAAEEATLRDARETETLSISRKALAISEEANSIASKARSEARRANQIAISAMILSVAIAIIAIIIPWVATK